MEWLTNIFETNFLFGLFLSSAAIGIGIFLLAFVFDAIFDGLFSVSFGDTSVPVAQLVATFLATAGGVGLMVSGAGVSAVAVAVSIAAGVGLVATVLTGMLIGKLHRDSNKVELIDPESLVGQSVPVIWWDVLEGEVLLPWGGNTMKVAARAEKPLHPGEDGVFEVAALEVVGDRPVSVTVKKFVNK